MLFNIVLLKKRRRLPGRPGEAGLRGTSSAGRLVPAIVPLPFLVVSLSWPLRCDSFPFDSFAVDSVAGIERFSESGGGGGGAGGGMSVPSVILPRLRSRAGSSKRELFAAAFLLATDDMTGRVKLAKAKARLDRGCCLERQSR